jgi:membrane-associated PAP2 superfamily phosphatase
MACHHRGPKDYTEEQQEQFMREFAAKRRRQIIVAIGIAPFLVLLMAGSRRWGEDPLIQLPFVFVVLGLVAVVGGLVFSVTNWRCPAPRWTLENRPLVDSSKPATTGVATETVLSTSRPPHDASDGFRSGSGLSPRLTA